MKDEQQQKKFQEIYEKFVRKCLTENMAPLMVLDYRFNSIVPVLDFQVVEEEEKEVILSSLNKKQ